MPSSFLHRQHGHSRGDRSCHTHSYTPHYGNDVPFEVPDSWEWTTISKLCSFLSRGKSPKYSEERKYPVFAQKCNLYDGDISLEKARFLDPNTLSKWSEEFKLLDGDILVNSTGTGTVGRTRLFHSDVLGDYPFVVPDSHVSVVRTFEEIESKFVLAFLSSDYGQTYIEDNLAGSTNQKELYIGVLDNMLFPLPPQEEQLRIVAAVDKWFSLINVLESAKGDLQTSIAHAKSKILDLAIHGKLVPQDPDDEPAIELLKRINPSFVPCDNGHSGKMPEGWIYCNLKDVANIQDNKRCPIKTEERNKRSKGKSILYPYYGATGIAGYIDDFLLDGKYILLGEDGAPFLDKYAKKAYETKGKIWVNNHVHILEPQINFSYLLHYLNTVDYSYYVKGTTRLKLTQSDMSSIKVLLPPLSEQQRIATKIEEIFAVLNEIQKSIED